MPSNQPIITRFPPSPTGPLHVGNVRTALFNFLFTRKNGGTFIVRVEDTDRARSKKEYETEMIDHLKWLGISFDNPENIIHQSERIDVYKNYLQKLTDSGKAYISHETEGENREVVRFKNPNKTVTWNDVVRGTISFDTTDLGDFIIARNINEPVYHLAVVIDDFESGVTHIIRGEDHISNTPRQILIQEALGAPKPEYAHIPLVLASDRSKLSKRKHGESVSLTFYRNRGYLPEAIVNFLALLGWNPGTDQEVFTLKELIEQFDLSKVQKGGAIFNTEKLDWLNKEHIKRLDSTVQLDYVRQYLPPKYSDETVVRKILPVILERISNGENIREMAGAGELDYFFSQPQYQIDDLLWKKDPDIQNTKNHLEQVKKLVENVDESNFTKEAVKDAVWPYAEQSGKGNVLWPMRFALSGRGSSPDPFILSEILGKKITLERLEQAIFSLQNHS